MTSFAHILGGRVPPFAADLSTINFRQNHWHAINLSCRRRWLVRCVQYCGNTRVSGARECVCNARTVRWPGSLLSTVFRRGKRPRFRGEKGKHRAFLLRLRAYFMHPRCTATRIAAEELLGTSGVRRLGVISLPPKLTFFPCEMH